MLPNCWYFLLFWWLHIVLKISMQAGDNHLRSTSRKKQIPTSFQQLELNNEAETPHSFSIMKKCFLVRGRGSPLAHHCTNVPHHQCPEKGTQDDHINMTTQWYKQALYLHSWTVFPVRCPPTAQGSKRYRKSLRTVNDNNNIKKVTINMSKP